MNTEQLQSRRRRFIAFGMLLGVIAPLALFGLSRAQSPQTPACILFWPEARYRNYGYDHLVHLSNACQTLATCAVSSDVTPTPLHIALKAGETTEVLLMRASAAREFTPHVECGLVL